MYTDGDRIVEALQATGWSETELPKSRLDSYAQAATDEVDSKLRLAYTVPFAEDPDNVPSLIGRITTALAAYQATLDWYGSTDLKDDDPVVRRWKWATTALEELRSGKASLGIEQASGGDDDGGGFVVNTDYSGSIVSGHFDAFGDPNGYGRWDRSFDVG